MSKYAPTEIIGTNLPNHPAVVAWRQLQPKCGQPEAIQILKQKKKSSVYRVVGVGPAGSAIIAKRIRGNTSIERIFYEEVLPPLPITSVRYYGLLAEPDGEHCWMFLEDAGEEVYSPFNEEHRTLAAKWLALMHMSAARVTDPARLFDRGPSWYLQHLRSARETIVQNLANRALSSEDLVILETLVSQFDVVESQWNELEEWCDLVPWTLVHGDFIPKNLRVRTCGIGVVLLPFDWEMAGWGVPAVDLGPDKTRVTADLYWAIVRDHWPSLDIHAFRRLENVAKIFRVLAAVNWKSESLHFEWIEGTIRSMESYQARMSRAIHSAGWADRA